MEVKVAFGQYLKEGLPVEVNLVVLFIGLIVDIWIGEAI